MSVVDSKISHPATNPFPFLGHLRDGGARGQSGGQVRATNARQDPPVQRVRLYDGHAQKGRQLHSEKSRPQSAGRPEGRHVDLNSNHQPSRKRERLCYRVGNFNITLNFVFFTHYTHTHTHTHIHMRPECFSPRVNVFMLRLILHSNMIIRV